MTLMTPSYTPYQPTPPFEMSATARGPADDYLNAEAPSVFPLCINTLYAGFAHFHEQVWDITETQT